MILELWYFEVQYLSNLSNKSNDILLDSAYNLDLSVFSKNISNLCTVYISIEVFYNFLGKLVTGFFSIFHVNIRIIKKNFEDLKKKKKCFLGFRFRIYYYRGVSVCVHNSFNIKTRPDLSINNENVESVTLEIVFEKTCKAIGNIPDRPPNEHFEPFQNFLTTLF